MKTAKITRASDQDGVTITILEDGNEIYKTDIPGTQWQQRKAGNEYRILSPEVTYRLTEAEISKIDSTLS
jgi:hypothetical protein